MEIKICDFLFLLQFERSKQDEVMAKTNKELMIPDELVMNRIYLVRGQKVMLDRDLAELYRVETKRLKEAVRRNYPVSR